jgi:hypothetical protein
VLELSERQEARVRDVMGLAWTEVGIVAVVFLLLAAVTAVPFVLIRRRGRSARR